MGKVWYVGSYILGNVFALLLALILLRFGNLGGPSAAFPPPASRRAPRPLSRECMADEAKKALQAEVVAVKQKWGDEIKLSKTKDGPTAPLPISLQRTIPAPEDAAAYDVSEYKVKLWLDSLDVSGEPLVRVEVDPADLVPSLARKMEERVGAQWRSELKARGLGKGWLLEKMFSWCESKFVELLNLDPKCLDMYMGEDLNGMTIRRFALTATAFTLSFALALNPPTHTSPGLR